MAWRLPYLGRVSSLGTIRLLLLPLLSLYVCISHGRDLPIQQPPLTDVALEATTAEPLPSASSALRAPTLLWEKCKEVRGVGEVCIGIYGDATAVPSTLGIQLTFLNQTFLLPIRSAQACVDDALLLKLLAANPHFAAFAKQIQALIVAEKVLAAEVLSECVLLTGFAVSQDDIDGAVLVDGCPLLESNWGCFRGHCVISTSKAYDCFHIRIPRRGEEVTTSDASVLTATA